MNSLLMPDIFAPITEERAVEIFSEPDDKEFLDSLVAVDRLFKKQEGEKMVVTLDKSDMDSILNLVADRIIRRIDIEKLTAEIKNKVAKEIKNEAITSETVVSSMARAVDDANVRISGKMSRELSLAISDAVTLISDTVAAKVDEINNITIGDFKITTK